MSTDIRKQLIVTVKRRAACE